jgi:hypothetical protein
VREARFTLFEGAAALDPSGARAIYLGFSGPFGVSPLVLLADAEEVAPASPLVAEVLTRQGWRPAPVEDATEGLSRRGIVAIFVGPAPVRSRLFGTEGYWIRLRPESEPAGWAPVLRR